MTSKLVFFLTAMIHFCSRVQVYYKLITFLCFSHYYKHKARWEVVAAGTPPLPQITVMGHNKDFSSKNKNSNCSWEEHILHPVTLPVNANKLLSTEGMSDQ